MKHKILFALFIACATHPITAITLTAADIRKIGEKIWNSEANCEITKLTHWNDGEGFASLGIGHFIWFPKGYKGRFSESFPDLIQFIAEHGRKIPTFLATNKKLVCPWNSREEFFAAFESKKMKELRQFLFDTIDLQTKFIIQRLEKALPYILKNLKTTAQRAHVKKQFYRVASTAMGLYALIDYTNFKGEGVNPGEAYNGHGWGLLQVLQRMKGEKKGMEAISEFSAAALHVLIKRVVNAPKGSSELRWLPGWKKRVNSYTLPFTRPNKNSCI